MVRPKSFLEREDTGVAQAIEVAVGLALLLIFSWLGFNSPDQTIKNATFSLSILGLLASIIWSIDLVAPKNLYTESIGFGKLKNFKIAGIVGLVFGFGLFVFLSGSPNALIVPFAVSFGVLAVLAALLEELSFRSVLIPTFARLATNYKPLVPIADYLGIIVGSALFAVFHFLAYGASVELMWVAFVFSILMVVGNTYFKSTAFGYSAHAVYNALVVGLILLG